MPINRFGPDCTALICCKNYRLPKFVPSSTSIHNVQMGLRRGKSSQCLNICDPSQHWSIEIRVDSIKWWRFSWPDCHLFPSPIDGYSRIATAKWCRNGPCHDIAPRFRRTEGRNGALNSRGWSTWLTDLCSVEPDCSEGGSAYFKYALFPWQPLRQNQIQLVPPETVADRLHIATEPSVVVADV